MYLLFNATHFKCSHKKNLEKFLRLDEVEKLAHCRGENAIKRLSETSIV